MSPLFTFRFVYTLSDAYCDVVTSNTLCSAEESETLFCVNILIKTSHDKELHCDGCSKG